MSNVKKSNIWTMEEVHKKINWHNEVHTYWHQFWHKIWRLLKLVKNTFYGHFEGFWSPLYLTSKLTSICVNLIMSIYFFVNLLHSLCVWLFDIWHLFNKLTSFWQLDIFLTAWHLFWHMGNRTHGQWVVKGVSWLILQIEMGHLGGWGTWVIGHMGNGAHEHNFLNTAWILTKCLLDIDIDVFYLNIQWYSHDGLI